MKKSKYNVIIDFENGEKIIYNTRTLGLSIIDENEFQLYNNIEHINKNETIAEFLESGFVIEDDCNEIHILRNRLNYERYSKENLRITIAPTLDCNFACSYCYEMDGEDKDYSIMNESIQEKLISFIEKKLFGCRNFSLVWYGGEPLLCMDIIKSLSKKIIDICDKDQIHYSATMVTNGYLLDICNIDEIKTLKIKDIQITLDGPQSVHNSRRMLKDKTGTYQKILDNIKKFSNDFDIIIRVNVDKINYKYLEDLINEIKNYKIKNTIFNIAPVLFDQGNENDMGFQTKEFTDIWMNFNEMCKKKEVNVGSYIIPQSSHYCDADFDNGFVIDANGYIYKCWRDIGNISKHICDLDGNINNTAQYYENMTYDATRDVKCKDCIVLPICMGGCPYDRIRNLERCSRFKYSLKHIVKKIVEEQYEEA